MNKIPDKVDTNIGNLFLKNAVTPENFAPLQMMTLSDGEFKSIRTLIYDKFGINLTEEKRSLIVGRLQQVIRNRKLSSFSDYIKAVSTDRSGEMISELVNRISTNHTFFGRENAHFDFFTQTVMPEIINRHKRRKDKNLRIWSAGCSSGEEAYTLVMLMMEVLGMEYGEWSAGLLATDISAVVMDTAKKGIYPAERLTMLSPKLKNTYFKKLSGDRFEVVDKVKKEVTYRRFNLMNRVFPFKKAFDVIFCRNVMIYFDQPTRDALVGRFFDWLEPGGYFFIGHSESIRRDNSRFDYIMPAVYRKKGA